MTKAKDLSPDNDPITKLVTFNIQEASYEELKSFLQKLHDAILAPYEQKTGIKIKPRRAKTATKTTKTKTVAGDL